MSFGDDTLAPPSKEEEEIRVARRILNARDGESLKEAAERVMTRCGGCGASISYREDCCFESCRRLDLLRDALTLLLNGATFVQGGSFVTWQQSDIARPIVERLLSGTATQRENES